jgi:hypothetical protein
MYMLPLASNAMPAGMSNFADVAAPPSPENPAAPVPATVEIVPPVVTLRTRLLLLSAMYRLPLLSNARPHGRFSFAYVAAPPSPE